MLEAVSFLNSVSELSKAEKDIQTSLKFGKDFSEMEPDLVRQAQDEILCSDWCLWREVQSQPQDLQQYDTFEIKHLTLISVSGSLFHIGNDCYLALATFVNNYRHVFQMSWEMSNPVMYSYGMGGMTRIVQSQLDRISFSSSFIFEHSSKKLQTHFIDFMKGLGRNVGFRSLHKPWT